VEAGAQIKWVFDPDHGKMLAFQEKFPVARAARCLQEILDDPAVQLVAAAAVPNRRGPLGCLVMESGKDYFTDKTPFTSMDQLAKAREVVAATGRKYAVYYGERLHSECSVHAGRLVEGGVIGRVIQTLGTGPHRLNAASRPAWFFEREKYGGIICDIGSHHVEQFLFCAGARAATVRSAIARNAAHPQHPGAGGLLPGLSRGRTPAHASQDRGDAGFKLLGAEGLGQVVVSAEIQARHPLGDGVEGGEKDDRHARFSP
jgi:predicted dehydrogenase